MTNCLLKLPCVNGSADGGAVLQYERGFFKYISFYVVKISSVFYSVLIIQLFCSASLCELAETGQWKTFGSSFTV